MDATLSSFFAYFVNVGAASLNQIFVLLGPGLALAVGMNYMSDALRRQTAALLGNTFWVYFTAIGVAIHELGHALFALLFLHKIVRIELFNPDPLTGTLGYVRHTYNPRNPYQVIGNFFIGVGPIILGTAVIYIASRFLVGPAMFLPFSQLSMDTANLGAFESSLAFFKLVMNNALQVFSILLNPDNYTSWHLVLFLYITLAVGSHLKLSLQDLESAWTGFVALVGVVFAINFITLWYGDIATRYIVLISRSYSFFYAIMIFTMVLTGFFILLFSLLLLVFEILRR